MWRRPCSVCSRYIYIYRHTINELHERARDYFQCLSGIRFNKANVIIKPKKNLIHERLSSTGDQLIKQKKKRVPARSVPTLPGSLW